MEPLERLLKLVALLLNAPRPMTFDEIREEMGAYTQEDREVAKRQFERDKDDLRRIGIPIETGGTDVYEVDVGYRIPKERYYLPEISFTPEEVAALFIAAHAPGPYGEAAQAFGKLARDADTAVISGLVDRRVPGLHDSGPHVTDAADAVARRRLVRFAYRPSGGQPSDREVDAWGLIFFRGAWYLVGRDRSADDVRSFRLSRVVSGLEDAGDAEPAPEGFDARERLRSGPWGVGEPETTATVAFSSKVAWWAREQAPGSTVLRTRRDAWVVLEVPASFDESFLGWVRAFGPDAEILGPADLRRRLAASLEEIRASL